MHRVVGFDTRDTGDSLEWSLRDARRGTPGAFTDTDLADARYGGVLIGDERSGPMIGLTALPPMQEGPPRFPAHGHDSDTWRISLKGTMSVGSATYEEGAFRFQHGGRPYGMDDVAWGPDGGWSLIMFGDRRGLTARPVDRGLQDGAVDHARDVCAWLGFEHTPDQPALAGMATTLGAPSRGGSVDGSFAGAEAWAEVVPGVRATCGLVGDHTTGPVVLLLQAGPSVTAFPAVRFATEVLLVVAGGACAAEGRTYEPGDVRLQKAGAPTPQVVAGRHGVELVAIVGDRRCGVPSDDGAEPAHAPTRRWVDSLRTSIDTLTDEVRGLVSA